MDVYLITFDLKPRVKDIAFAEALARFLGHMKTNGRINGGACCAASSALAPVSTASGGC